MGPQGISTQAEADVKEPSQSSGVLQFSTAEITNVLEKKKPQPTLDSSARSLQRAVCRLQIEKKRRAILLNLILFKFNC